MSWERDIERLELKLCNVNSRINDVEGRVRGVETRQAVAETNIKTHSDILEKIHNNTNWLLRLVVGIMVAALLGLIMQ